MTLYAQTIEGARSLMATAFAVFPHKSVRLLPFGDGYAVQVY